jgi:alpha-tubulin suppressor-like RCC1 family protein
MSERGAALGGWRSAKARSRGPRRGRHAAPALASIVFMAILGANALGGGLVGEIAAPRAAGAAVVSAGPALLAAGNGHSCAVLAAGTVKCWGLNGDGELGNGAVENAFRPVSVTGLAGIRSITAGDYHSCAVLNGGTVKCWGYNFHGELGVSRKGPTTCSRRPGSVGQPCSTTPVSVGGLSGVASIAAGAYQTCALLTKGTVKCWGYNAEGQLGNGTLQTSSKPVSVVGLTGVRAITSGGVTACALLGTGTVKCWGNGYRSTPVTIVGLRGVVGISAGYYYVCAVLATGTVKCWGSNDFGQLGNGSFKSTSQPTTVSEISDATAIASGEDHACARLRTGTVSCWGYDQWGQIGSRPNVTPTTNCGDGSPCHPTPGVVKGLSGVAAIAAGYKHSCARLESGSIRCWGYNNEGELGNRDHSSSYTPVAVDGL